VRGFLETSHRLHAGEVVSIVTGKGLRSQGPPVLEPLVRALLEGDLARFVAGFTRDSARGRFVVRVR
jgi:DNA-nicking Smr family endonuclease